MKLSYRIKGWRVQILLGFGYFRSPLHAFQCSYIVGQTGMRSIRLPFLLAWRVV